MTANDPTQIAELIAEWRRTCKVMNIPFTDRDVAKFIAYGLPDVHEGVATAHLAEANRGNYRTKPVEVDARELTDDPRNHAGIVAWIESHGGAAVSPFLDHVLGADTLGGRMVADIGDYVIKGVQEGEFYSCTPDIFEATHELVEGNEMHYPDGWDEYGPIEGDEPA